MLKYFLHKRTVFNAIHNDIAINKRLFTTGVTKQDFGWYVIIDFEIQIQVTS